MRALETAWKWTGVHGDVPLPWVDVGRPGGENLGFGAGGGRRPGSRGRWAGVERRGISRWTRAVQVELLQDQVIPNLQEGRE
jgi:hypothetical protein